jgi:hypothetical protein
MSLLLATTILAVGGLGLYMYKSSEDGDSSRDKQDGGDDYNEDSLFGSKGGFWGSDDDEEVVDKEPEVVESKVRSRGGAKTKRNRKNVGSKRRY